MWLQAGPRPHPQVKEEETGELGKAEARAPKCQEADNRAAEADHLTASTVARPEGTDS